MPCITCTIQSMHPSLYVTKILDIRARELAELQFGGFSEGCGLSMIHMIPVFTVSFITLVSLLFEKQISFVEVDKILKKKASIKINVNIPPFFTTVRTGAGAISGEPEALYPHELDGAEQYLEGSGFSQQAQGIYDIIFTTYRLEEYIVFWNVSRFLLEYPDPAGG